MIHIEFPEGSACDSYPCWNEGSCLPSNFSKRDYSCECGPLFVGDHCQFRVAQLCLQAKCTPGTSCEVDGFNVKCPENYISEFLTSCLTNTCMNGGQCLEGSHGHRCYCQSPFQGPFCQYEAPQGAYEWSAVEISLIGVLIFMIIATFVIIFCSGNIGFYVSIPNKRYSRWEEGDISEEDEDQEIALGDMKEIKKKPQLRLSQTSETIVEENECANNAPTCSKYGVVDL